MTRRSVGHLLSTARGLRPHPRCTSAVRTTRAAAHVSLLVAVLLAACTGDDRPVVEVEPVTAGEVVATVSAPARVDAAARQDVSASVSGVVVALEAADGDSVEGGQTVVRLESSQVALAQQQAAAAQDAASNVGGITVSGAGQGTIAAAERAVADLDATSQPAIAEARERAAEIADPQQAAAAQAAVLAVESTYLNTRAALLASAHALAEQQAAVTSSLTDALNQAVAQATAGQRAQAQSAAALAAQQAAGLEVVAPFAGTVSLGDAAATDGGAASALAGQLGASGLGGAEDLAGLAGSLPGLAGGEGGGTLRVGAPVTAGQTLFTVYDLSTRYVNADVDEVDAPSVTAGQEAVVVIDAFPDATFRGVVESVAVEAAPTEAGGVGYRTRIHLTGADADGDDEPPPLDRLLVGQTASAEITVQTTAADLVVPSRALVDREGRTVVYALRDGRAEQVEVTTVTLGEDAVAVRGDLAEGEEVVVAGYEELGDGDEVRLP